MNPKNVLLVYGKELRDTLRDRRTIGWSIVFPVVLIPAMMFGMFGIMGALMDKASAETATVVLLGEEHAPGLAQRIRAIERFTFVDAPDDLDAAIGDKRIRAAIEIPPDFDRKLAAGQRPSILVRYHDGEFRSERALRDLREATLAYRQELVESRLARYGLGRADLEPFALDPHNVATRAQVTGRSAGGLVPYVIILMAVIGAMFPAIDLTAGEKERGTMETILASSVGRLDLVLGKFLTVMTSSMATVVLAMGSLALTALVIVPRLAPADAKGDFKELTEMLSGIDLAGIVGLLGLILPLTLLFSAALMSVALLGRSLREAQQYVGPLPAVVIVPAMIGMLPAIDLNWKTALIPITSTSLAGKELLAGSFDWGALALIFGSSCVYAAVALLVATRLFQREEVLFRT